MGLKVSNKTIKGHKEEANEINSSLQTLTNVVETNYTEINKKFDEKIKHATDRMNATDTDNMGRFNSLHKDLEKLKFDLTDVIDSKFEYIVKNIELQTNQLKKTYDDLSSSLKETGKDLNDNFKDKVVHIKSMVATYFAKVDV